MTDSIRPYDPSLDPIALGRLSRQVTDMVLAKYGGNTPEAARERDEHLGTTEWLHHPTKYRGTVLVDADPVAVRWAVNEWVRGAYEHALPPPKYRGCAWVLPFEEHKWYLEEWLSEHKLPHWPVALGVTLRIDTALWPEIDGWGRDWWPYGGPTNSAYCFKARLFQERYRKGYFSPWPVCLHQPPMGLRCVWHENGCPHWEQRRGPYGKKVHTVGSLRGGYIYKAAVVVIDSPYLDSKFVPVGPGELDALSKSKALPEEWRTLFRRLHKLLARPLRTPSPDFLIEELARKVPTMGHLLDSLPEGDEDPLIPADSDLQNPMRILRALQWDWQAMKEGGQAGCRVRDWYGKAPPNC